MKIVAVDLRFLETPTGKRGVGYYNKHIFKNMLGMPHPDFKFKLFTFPLSNLSKSFTVGPDDKFLKIPAMHWPKRGLRRLDPFFSIFWKQALKSAKPDILHLPFVFDVYYLGIPDNIKTIITLYDVIPLLFPDQYFQNKKAEDWYRQRFEQVKKAARIITISNSSKKDIIKNLNISGEKITVIYGGVSENFRVIEREKVVKTLARYNINTPYILTVSTHSFHKNISGIFQAFKKYITLRKNTNLNLVVVCKLIPAEERDWRKELKDLGILDKVILTNFVPDEDLPAFYNGAEVFLFPSFYEGLGMPVLEAMASGTPVITSNRSSLGEVGGEAVYYVDPQNIPDISRSLSEVLENKKLRTDLVKKGLEQVKKFSWEKSAKQTLDVYEEVGQLT